MMPGLRDWVLAETAWLYTRLYQNQVFFLDLWSFAHFWAGMGLLALLSAWGAKARFRWLMVALLAYEIAELALIFFAFHVFRPETLKDQLTDVLVGLAGGVAVLWIIETPRLCTVSSFGHESLRDLVAFASSLLLAFTWVGSYGYEYSLASLNSPGLNWWALFLWTLGLFLVVELHEFLAQRRSGTALNLLLVWISYAIGMLTWEFLGYHLVAIREVGHTGSAPLVFDLVHGTKALHAFYLTAPFLVIGMHGFFLRVLTTARARIPEPSQVPSPAECALGEEAR